MRALSSLAAGLLLVGLDLRFNSLDVLPDPIGWVVAILALASLTRRHTGFLVATVAAGVALVASLPDWVRPGNGLVDLVGTVTLTTVVFATCTAIMATVPSQRRPAELIRWWDLGLTLVGLVLGLAAQGGTADAALVLLVLPLVLAGLGVFVWFLVVLVRAGRPEVPQSAA